MPINTVLAAVAAVLFCLAVILAGRAWFRFRGSRVITCPENRRPAGVYVDAGHAARTALFKAPELRLQSCSRWPEKQGCGQDCLSQISEAPENCLVRNIFARWFLGKACIYCARHFGEIDWQVSRPALITPEGKLLEVDQVPAERVYEVLETHRPVCATCYVTNEFVRQHPELVVDRSGLR